MKMRTICLGHGQVMEFQIFPQIIFCQWLKSKEIFEPLCQASKCSASGVFRLLFSPVLLSILRS